MPGSRDIREKLHEDRKNFETLLAKYNLDPDMVNLLDLALKIGYNSAYSSVICAIGGSPLAARIFHHDYEKARKLVNSRG